MKVYLIPKSEVSKWPVRFIIALAVSIAIYSIVFDNGHRDLNTNIDHLLLTVPVLFAGLMGVAAYVTGLFSIIQSREKSMIVLISVLIGIFVLIFAMGELFSGL
jgi:hypothetical protein